MLRLPVLASIICLLTVGGTASAADAPKDPGAKDTTSAAPANLAPPVSSIATFEGEYFCIFHDRVYSVGAIICVAPKLGLLCSSGAFAVKKNPASAASWDKQKDVDYCAGVTPPIPQ
jgi:hypothetical protein